MLHFVSGLTVYPLVFAVFPIVSLYSSNVALVSVDELKRPLSVAIVSVIAINVLLFFVIRDRHKRGVVVLGCVVSYYALPYWMILSTRLDDLGMLSFLIKIACLVVLTMGVGFGIRILRRKEASLVGVTRFLNAISVGAILTALLTVAMQGDRKRAGLPQKIGSYEHSENFSSDNPDIFHIILDGFARSDVLNDLYGYDNSAFIRNLEEMGFYVASKSVSNYHWTGESLSSMLNFQYHSEIRGQGVPKTSNIRKSKILRMVEDLGYTTVAFASGYSPTEISHADVYLRPRVARSDFEVTLMQRRTEREQDVHDPHRKRVTFIMDSLEALVPNQYGQPLFVFAHIKSPHSPFVFGRNGEAIESVPRNKWLAEYKTSYRNQVEYIGSRMTEVLRSIRAHFPDAIIIVHGDHGPRADTIRANGSREDFIADHVGILNALYLPGERGVDRLYPSISLVNTYRVILNAYFGFEHPLLEDYSYVAPQNYEWMSKSTRQYTKVMNSPKVTERK